jgi:hypothetical protein
MRGICDKNHVVAAADFFGRIENIPYKAVQLLRQRMHSRPAAINVDLPAAGIEYGVQIDDVARRNGAHAHEADIHSRHYNSPSSLPIRSNTARSSSNV